MPPRKKNVPSEGGTFDTYFFGLFAVVNFLSMLPMFVRFLIGAPRFIPLYTGYRDTAFMTE